MVEEIERILRACVTMQYAAITYNDGDINADATAELLAMETALKEMRAALTKLQRAQ